MVIHAAILGRPLDLLRYRGDSSLAPGDLVRVPLGTQCVPACVVSRKEGDEEDLKKVEEVIVPRLFPQQLLDLAEHISSQHLGFLGEALGLILPRDIMMPPKRRIKEPRIEKDQRRLKMRTDENRILQTFKKSSKPMLVHSSADYTGLVVELVRDVMGKGKEALLIFPDEPGLARFYERTSPYMPLALYHSEMGQGERRRVWHGVRQGLLPLVAGLRSAVLLPFTNPGLIVLADEESDSHRVRSHHLHYNARDLAVFRAEKEGARVLLFSHAPSLETSHKARSGKLAWIEHRVAQHGKALIVDMKKDGEATILSKTLLEEIKAARERGMQALLLLNRLGLAARLLCLDCGHVPTCPTCDMPFKFVGKGAALVCPICHNEIPAPEHCSECGGARWQSLSFGLESLDRELKRCFPHDRLLKITAEHRPIIEDAQQAEIIYGTIAVLEYLPPKVQVAALLSWDAERSRADFRAAERAFRNVAYLRRILTSSTHSRLVVQTFRPRNRLLLWALRGDYESFFQSEVRRRRELGYPPYRRLLLFEAGRRNVWDAEKLLEAIKHDGAEALGPYRGRRGRSRILVKIRRDLEPADLIDARTLLRSGWQAEVDPVEIL
ncbi:primosomal protein N' [candidate division WOR-3 bacterium]|nr:primosomal protein N' [candidate division WOR-3 bacterium]MCK4334674.1 primosomal protein N' [candidate division WOR-3 bacterium]